jgi:4-hydroxy-tetrahydrodipicolinate synthase
MTIKAVPVRGVIADVVIPYATDEGVDWDCLKREVRLLTDCGVHALSLGGTLGGTLGATADELALLCGEVKRSSKAAVFAIVFPDAMPEALEMVRAVNDAGVDVIAVAQPHYLSQPGTEGVMEMFADLKRTTNRPLIIADCLTGSPLGVHAIRALITKKVADGVLESADMHVLVDLLCLDLGVPVYSGVEDLHYLAFIMGADGIISDFATVCPAELLELYTAVQKRDYAVARTTHERLVRLWRSLNCGVEQEARVRSALAAQGRRVGSARRPYRELPSGVGNQISTVLQEEGIGLRQQ